jgi:membrane protease YdiL (CAAX protease family)
MRIATGVVLFAIVVFLLGTGLLPRASLEQFISDSRSAAERLVNVSAMQHSSAYFWLTLTLASFVGAGMREQMWRAGTLAAMRALWPGTFGDRPGQIAAVALIAIVFGLAHLGDSGCCRHPWLVYSDSFSES